MLSVGSFQNSLCLSFLFLSHQLAFANPFSQSFRTKHYSVEPVWSIIQDRRGFLWIGTADGLNRFDGYSFRTFRHDPMDANSLANNVIWSLCEDRHGAIWVGTGGGVHRFDPRTGKFFRLADDPKYKGTYLEALSHSILEDHTLDPTNGC